MLVIVDVSSSIEICWVLWMSVAEQEYVGYCGCQQQNRNMLVIVDVSSSIEICCLLWMSAAE